MLESLEQFQSFFDQSGESCLTALNISHCSKLDKKRHGGHSSSNSYYLVLSIKKSPPFSPSLYLLKLSNNKVHKTVNRASWDLVYLLSVNTFQTSDELVFKLNFENSDPLSVNPIGIKEKNDFIDILWQTCYRYFERMPVFHDYTPKSNTTIKVSHDEIDDFDITKADLSSFHPTENIISSKDQEQLIAIIDMYKDEINNIDDFAVKLNDQLDRMKWDNLITIIESEEECKSVVKELDQCIDYVEGYEKLLDNCDNALLDLSVQIKELEMVDSDRELKIKNQLLLYNTLNKFIVPLDIDPNIVNFINNAKYESDMEMTNKAADVLCSCIRLNLPEAFKMVGSFSKQMNYCQKLSDKFANKINMLLNLEISQISKEFMNTSTNTNTISITNHRGIHIRLSKYASILNSLKLISNATFTAIYNEYTKSISLVYYKQISELIDDCIKRIEGDEFLINSKNNNKESVLKFDNDCMKHLDNFKSIHNQLFEVLISNVVREIKFCDSTFFNSDKSYNADNTNDIRPSKLHNIRLRTIVDKIFSPINEKINTLFNEEFRIYPMYIIHVQNHLYVMSKSVEDTKMGYFKSSVDQWKKFCEQNLFNLRNYLMENVSEKTSLKKARNQQKFLLSGHNVFKDSIKISMYILRDQSSANIDPKFDIFISKQMLKTLSKTIDSLKNDSDNEIKSLPFIIENYHHLHHTLLELRVMPEQRKKIKESYKNCLDRFATICYSDQIKVLETFISGIKSSLAHGVAINEIKFQSAFSKNILDKILSNYTIKEIRKIVESCRKLVDKYFTASNLGLIVWGQMQTNFQDKFKDILVILDKCYSLSSINYDVTLDAISLLFSNKSGD